MHFVLYRSSCLTLNTNKVIVQIQEDELLVSNLLIGGSRRELMLSFGTKIPCEGGSVAVSL